MIKLFWLSAPGLAVAMNSLITYVLHISYYTSVLLELLSTCLPVCLSACWSVCLPLCLCAGFGSTRPLRRKCQCKSIQVILTHHLKPRMKHFFYFFYILFYSISNLYISPRLIFCIIGPIERSKVRLSSIHFQKSNKHCIYSPVHHLYKT